MMKISKATICTTIGGICVLLAGCAITDWQKEGASEQDKAADSQACDAYIAQDASVINVSIDARMRAHPKLAEWHQRRVAERATHLHEDFRGRRSDQSNSSFWADLAANVVGALFEGAAAEAERAALHNECMVAMGWTPSQPGSSSETLASATTPTDGGEPAQQANAPQFVILRGEPIIGQEPRQQVTIWQLIPPDPPASGQRCTTYPRLECQ